MADQTPTTDASFRFAHEAMASANEAGVHFLMAELDLGLTFLRVSRQEHDEATAQKQIFFAVRCAETARRFARRLDFGGGEKPFQDKLAELVNGLTARSFGASPPELSARIAALKTSVVIFKPARRRPRNTDSHKSATKPAV